MAEEMYERLANALDALPNHFPRTASGVEIKLLKKAFTPEEAELAGQLSIKYETVPEIAGRVSLPEDKVKGLLDAMLPRALVIRAETDGVEKFRLGPFVVGWYERYVITHPTDKEFAELFEEYMPQAATTVFSLRPGLARIVPVRGSLKPELVQPYDDIDAHFQRHERFVVMNCMCRLEKNVLGSDCPMPVRRCVFRGVPPETPLSQGDADPMHVLDREQALKLFGELEEMGHVHIMFHGGTAYEGGCNCCGDCCGVLRSYNEWGAERVEKSNYRAVLDLEKCNACGNCIERCQLHAITEGKDGMPVLNVADCMGCGQCVIACPTDATELVPVSAEEWYHVPVSREEWEEQRLRNRGVTA